MEPLEVIISSDTATQLWSASVWDSRTGTSLASYRGGGVAAERCLCVVGEDYVAAVERAKPLLHVWPLNSQERVQGLRLVLPGKATAMAFSPDGFYCVVGVVEKIYVWQISSGALLATLSKHYQTVNRIEFCDDGSHFVSAGDDGVVLVWNLMNVVSHFGIDITTSSNSDPVFVLSDHSLSVKDIYVGKGGIRSRLVTCSLDRTCKIYDLTCGELLLNVVFDKCLSAVTMDLLEMNVFVGSVDGDIYQFSIVNPPRTREYHTSEGDKPSTFAGHTKAITCLSCSIDGETLISGSNDESLNVWHVPSKQKVHSIPHKGPITNAFFTVVPKNMFINKFNPALVWHNFQRVDDDNIEILTAENPSGFWESDNDFSHEFSTTSNVSLGNDSSSEKLNDEINKLKKANENLYKFAVENIVKDIKNKAL